jgi:hypothetical protein
MRAMPRTPRAIERRPSRARVREVLSAEWCIWVAENLASGVAASSLVRGLVANGVSRDLATRAVAEIRSSPALHAVAALERRRNQAELASRLVQSLAKHRATKGIERRTKPSANELFDRYWAGNRPAVFTDAMRGWKLWSPQDMKRLLGRVRIEVTENREADPFYDERFREHSRKTTMGAFVDRVLAAGETNDFYMVANNKTMDRPALARLLERVVIDETWFDPKRVAGGTSLWLGPKGTVTPLHHDTTNILFCQVHGRKKFLLAAPSELRLLDVARGFYADLDPEAPDLERHPWFRDVTLHSVILEPGEALFLPVGWWHHVRSLDVSISLSLLNFRRMNAFDWYRPGH